MKLAIIGTAGRGDDAKMLTMQHWTTMVRAAHHILKNEHVTSLVSGGAAWADHVAIQLFHDTNREIPLELFLPAIQRDLSVAQWYHEKFSQILKRDTWVQVCDRPARFHGSFKDRNTLVANAADIFLACTFGHRNKVKDGGTADTVRKMLAQNKRGYHLDLHTLKLYPNATTA